MTLPRRGALRAGLVFVVLTLLVLGLAVSINANFGLPFNLSLSPPGQDYQLRASFADSNGLIRGADVVVAGHPIGQVVNVSVAGDRAQVAMRIGRNFAPVHRGTVARIRYSTLLAQKYVELSPVAGAENLPGGSTIPTDDTITPVDFDQFLSAFDPETRQRVQAIVQQLGGGLDGRQVVINDLLDQLNRLSVESQPGLATISAHDVDIDRIVANLAVTSRRLTASRAQLGDLVQQADTVNTTLAAKSGNLTSFFVHLAATMNDFDSTLNGEEGNLRSTVQMLDPTLSSVNSVLGVLNPALDQNLATLKHEFSTLAPEMESAVHSSDANGNYLRQYLVSDQDCDKITDTKNGCGSVPPPSNSSNQSQKPAPNSSGTNAGGGGQTGGGSGAPSTPAPSSPTPTPWNPTPAPTPTPTCDPVSYLTGKCR